jgi:hypothetical protein
MKGLFYSVLGLACVSETVYGHGIVSWAMIGGKNYTGYNPFIGSYDVSEQSFRFWTLK